MPNDDRGCRFCAGALALFCAAAACAAVVFLINLISFSGDAAPYLQAMAVETKEFRPETAERVSYLAILLVLPFILFGFYVLCQKYLQTPDGVRLRRKIPAVSCTAAILWFFAALASGGDFFRLIPLYGVVLVFAVVFAIDGKFFPDWSARLRVWSGYLMTAACAGIFVCAVFYGIFNENAIDNTFGWQLHFSAVFQPVWEVFNGKLLLRDVFNQYGLYPHFIVPLFKITGLSVLKFALLMSALTGAGYVFVFLLLGRTIKNRLILYWTFFALILLQFFYPKLAGPEVYFQYVPLRMIFPALGVWLASRWFEDRTRARYALCMLVCALSVLWNFDSGAVLFIAWLLTLWFVRFSENTVPAAFRSAVKDTLVLFAFLAAEIALYGAAMSVFYGGWPDFSAFFSYIGLYYGGGYFMLPMRPLDSWNIAAFLYIGGLLACVPVLLKERPFTPESGTVFLLSLLGAGLFSYYQGRSHVYNLCAVMWPAFMLAGIFADSLFENGVPRGGAVRLARAAALFVMLCVMFFGAASSVKIAAMAFEKLEKTHNGNSSVSTHAAYVAAQSGPGESVQIVSYSQAAIELLAGRKSKYLMPSLAETVLKSQHEKIREAVCVRDVNKVFIDTYIGQMNPEYNAAIIKAARQCGTLKGCSGDMCLYVKQP